MAPIAEAFLRTAAFLAVTNFETGLAMSGFTSVQAVLPSGQLKCLYLSDEAVFPFNSEGSMNTNAAEEKCAAAGLELADIGGLNGIEQLYNLAVCYMRDTHPDTAKFLISSSSSVAHDSSKECNFLDLSPAADGSDHLTSEGVGDGGSSCFMAQANAGGGSPEEPYFVCMARAACDPSPDYEFGQLVCDDPTPPAETGLAAAAEQPNRPFCPGKEAVLNCDVGGWNKLIDDPTSDTVSVTCGDDLEFAASSGGALPICGSVPHCPALEEPAGMQMEWDQRREEGATAT